ncbi:dicarboxylic amino acid permease [Trichoderma compactum]
METSPKPTFDQDEGVIGTAILADEANQIPTNGQNGQLKRSLNSRQINMFSIAGSIGTGLLIATGSALANGGPDSMPIAFAILGFICYNVLVAYGEMSTAFPMDKGFSGYAARFYAVLLANNLTASGLIMQHWLPHVNVGVWIVSFAGPIICINLFPVKVFREIEFVAAIIKTLVILGLMILCLVIDLGGGPNHDRLGFRYWKDPGAFNAHLVEGATGRFLGWWSCMVSAGFVYMGTEVVGVAFGEADKPWKVIPRAIRQTLWRILFLYVGAVFLLGLVVPYNSPNLMTATNSRTGAGASPFIVAIKDAGISLLPGFINVCLLVFVLSAANSGEYIYIASRTLYGLARDSYLTQVFTRTYGAVPIVAVGTASIFFLLALMNVTTGSNQIFSDLVSLRIMVTYLSFRRGMEAQNMPRASLPYTEPWMKLRVSGSLFITCLVVLFNGVGDFIPSFQAKPFVSAYVGIPIHIVLILAPKFLFRYSRVQPASMDLFTGPITAEEKQAAERGEKQKAPQRGLGIFALFRRRRLE